MAFDFPASPVLDDEFVSSDGKTWTWNGSVWNKQDNALVYTNDAPPTVPIEDQLWWNTSTGETFIYYDDGTSQQWVQTAPGVSGVSGITDAPSDGTRYERQDAAWVPSRTVAIVSDAAPTNPIQGELWFDSLQGKLLMWYEDATSGQWVQV
jgi:hypothetical protein